VNIKNNAGLYPDDLTQDNRLSEILWGKNAVEIKVAIPKENIGKVIGKGGSKLKELRAETKTIITIPQQDEKSNEVTIKGRPDNVDIAKKKILDATSNKVELLN
jgi:predicted RNA-binding protein YlqC (UPF0109 family)